VSPFRLWRTVSASKDVRPSAMAISSRRKTSRVSGTKTLCSETRSSSLLSAANNLTDTSLTSTILTIVMACWTNSGCAAKYSRKSRTPPGSQLIDRCLDLGEVFLPDRHPCRVEAIAVSLLALAQGGFGASAARNVHHDPTQPRCAFFVDDHGHQVSQPHDAAVRGDHAVLEIVVAFLACCPFAE